MLEYTSSRFSDYSLVKEHIESHAEIPKKIERTIFCKRRWQLSLPSS